MGKPISSVGGASAPAVAPASTASAGQRSPTQSPMQSPVQSPVQSAPAPAPKPPVTFWPPAYGWRLAALEEGAKASNGWQAKWLEHGSAVAGGGPVDAVAQLKTQLRPHLRHG